ncbi:hypothetical protein GFY24_24570 [Nocardia sp. SYP-A9097]|uniref:hypothetical protein n=1 Tax=Nocardia sp. SYP-A9097 TaxID=2663237 RepID=UPI00129AE075|nr:hypothetical protein [Nocardia sp. SYP-A9097]MRH90577.1 hypothetical protein [Nocardia sp. SYP-A9097]
MRHQPAAIGFLRHDVSRAQQRWDQAQMRHLARRLGYDLCRTLVCGPATAELMEEVRAAISQTEADAVITPSLDHFDGAVPDPLVQVADVITVSPENTYARWRTRPA